jgi:hypothetical protein
MLKLRQLIGSKRKGWNLCKVSMIRLYRKDYMKIVKKIVRKFCAKTKI